MSFTFQTLSGLRQQKNYFRHVPSEDSGQLVHSCSLIRNFTGCILDIQGCKISSWDQRRTLIRLGLICFAADKVYYTAMEGTSCCWYKMVLVEYTRPGNEGVNSYEARNSSRFVWICITPNKALFFSCNGVVRCGEGVVYLTSLGRPTGIGLQLGKACYPCSR